jgi:dethiobiotin synthetase
MPAIFVTGSGTDVGKTYLTASLARHLRARGDLVQALKPVVSGFDPAAPSGGDPAVLLEALGRKVMPSEWEALSPWRFQEPLSPDMAAALENRTLDFEGLVAFCRSAIARPGALLIEGIGGVMVPLDTCHTVLDWIARLEVPVVLVGGTYLGTLSHILSAQDVLLNRGLDLRAIVVSETPRSTVSIEATRASLARFAKAPLLALARKAEPDACVIGALAQLCF